jgi:hypothetical protein
VGPYGYPVAFCFIQIRKAMYVSLFQHLQNLIVVNQRSVGVDNLTWLAIPGSIQYKIHCPPYPHAEARIFCYSYLHQVTFYLSYRIVVSYFRISAT